MTDEEDIRFQALTLANMLAGPRSKAESVLDRAQAYYDWITGKVEKPALSVVKSFPSEP